MKTVKIQLVTLKGLEFKKDILQFTSTNQSNITVLYRHKYIYKTS